METTVNYQKRKNQELFKSLEGFGLVKTQNYIPLYNRFFVLNETNYNGVNLNHSWYLSNVQSNLADINPNLYKCTIKHSINEKSKPKTKNVFFKLAPLLDPFKFMIGKYDWKNSSLFHLPSIRESTAPPKTLDMNNSAYVDSFFSYLTSKMVHNNGFIHGLDFYGSFLAIKNDFKVNIFDDLDYLTKSDFFNKQKNVLFEVEDYSNIFSEDGEDGEKPKLAPIKIFEDATAALVTDIFDESVFDTVFTTVDSSSVVSSTITTENLKELEIDFTDLHQSKTETLKSGSSCSSRTSHTGSHDEIDEDDESGDWSDIDGESGSGCDNSDDDDNDDDESEEEEHVYATFKEFPVQVICMENCENTFDDLILHNDLSEVEWFSALMQVVMILITYQKVFSFTHNDLHTNNIMYVNTEKEFIYYCYKKKYYRVPTFGRIFKIIDFGRSIYKFDGKIMCSDSFQLGGDASTQYNTEPYYNDKKPRLEPNYSFDLCRLACSIFDYLVDSMDSIRDLNKCDAITRVIVEWCLDDNGINVLYKNNGADRYPDFKLYKMIARYVHNHTPQAQLERKEFNAFTISKNKIPNNEKVLNLDNF